MTTNSSTTEVNLTLEPMTAALEIEKGNVPTSSPELSGNVVDEIPDGGTTAWLVVFGTWCTSFCSFGWINSVGVFQDYYQRHLLSDYSSSTIAWIPSLQIFFAMFMVRRLWLIVSNPVLTSHRGRLSGGCMTSMALSR